MIVVGVEGSEAVRLAFREAEARGRTLEAVRAWRCPAHETADHPLLAGAPERCHEDGASALLETSLAEETGQYPAVRVRRCTVEGPAHKVLPHRTAAADLLVIGADDRRSQAGFALGRAPLTPGPR